MCMRIAHCALCQCRRACASSSSHRSTYAARWKTHTQLNVVVLVVLVVHCMQCISYSDRPATAVRRIPYSENKCSFCAQTHARAPKPDLRADFCEIPCNARARATTSSQRNATTTTTTTTRGIRFSIQQHNAQSRPAHCGTMRFSDSITHLKPTALLCAVCRALCASVVLARARARDDHDRTTAQQQQQAQRPSSSRATDS